MIRISQSLRFCGRDTWTMNVCCNYNKIYRFLSTQRRSVSYICIYIRVFVIVSRVMNANANDSMIRFTISVQRKYFNFLGICQSFVRKSKYDLTTPNFKLLQEWKVCCILYIFVSVFVNQFIRHHVRTSSADCTLHCSWSVEMIILKIIHSKVSQSRANDEIVIHVFFIIFLLFMFDEKWLTYFGS